MTETFPITSKFRAREVTDLNYRIEPDSELYVNLDSVRGKKFLNKMCYNLNFIDDKLTEPLAQTSKILFSGHRGSGKSMELKRFHQRINHPEGYCSVFIEIEKEVELYAFQKEDFFVLLVTKLIEKLDELEINVEGAELIAKEWLSEKEIIEEISKLAKIEVSGEASAEAGFLKLLRFKSVFRSMFSGESKSAEKIRQSIKRNPKKLAEDFNLILSEARSEIEKKGCGKDLIFIVDGSEKIPLEIYTEFFVDDPELILSINANMICAVPINTYFDIKIRAKNDYFNTYLLPVIQFEEEEDKKVFAQIISNRVDRASFIDEDALLYAVDMSGGSPRQLLRIFNRALIDQLGEKISLKDCKETCKELGQEMRDMLRTEHVTILKNQDWDDSNEAMLDLLFSLVILKCNGHKEINPLLTGFI